MEMSRVTVIMCTYNGEKYLHQQLDSILNQTYPIFEVLVQDDLSSDSTVEIIRTYSERYPNIHLFVNPVRLGPHPNFINLLTKADGDFIAISDQDDIWELDKIEKLMKIIEHHTMAIGLSESFGDGVLADSERRVPNVNTLRLMFYPVVPGHSMLVRRDVVEKIPKDCFCKVYDLLVALSACVNGSIVVLPEVLTHHRRHIGAFSYSKPKNYSYGIWNAVSYFFKGMIGFFRKKQNIKRHFSIMHSLLLMFGVSDDGTINGDALKFTQYMSECSLFDLVKASKICYNRRSEIFYTKTKDGIILKCRAILWPFLCSDYY